MVGRASKLLLAGLLLGLPVGARAAEARFDLVGPRIDVRVTRGSEENQQTLPIASVPNLQGGDRLWIHPDLPPTQSVKYLLICVFLRGTTNPPPDSWFFRVETWRKEARQEGTFITVPAEAQQAVLFLAPETGGDFSTLKSAVQGRPGVFVRASQDLAEAGFEQARIEKYLASIRRVPPADAESLQRHSELLARTLALKPNADCFKRSPDTQFTCLTQTGTQTLLDDGHGQTIASSLANGPNADLIQAASYTNIGGGGVYSAYVGAVVDLVRVMANLHTAQYQYIPAIAFPQGEAMNLRLNTPPSFHNPKSVMVIGLPAVQTATAPPLRPADNAHVVCLLQPSVVLPIEGAPLVFSTDLAHDLRLHLNTAPGQPAQPDILLTPDAFQGGFVLQHNGEHRAPLRDKTLLTTAIAATPTGPDPAPASASQKGTDAEKTEPTIITGTVTGRWGFDSFTGPTVQLQQRVGENWRLVSSDQASGAPDIIAGHTGELRLASTGTACVHTISAQPSGMAELPIQFKPEPRSDGAGLLLLSLPAGEQIRPGDLHLAIQQFGQPKADVLAARTFDRPARVDSVDLHAGDKSLLLVGADLGEIDALRLGDLVFKPSGSPSELPGTGGARSFLRFSLAAEAPAPPTHPEDHLNAAVHLRDGRSLSLPITVAAARPAISLLSKTVTPPLESGVSLASQDELPLAGHLTFTLKAKTAFPRNGQIEVETLDGALRAVLTLAPSGGLLLQDPHTVVASLDPLRSFGPSAFGALHVRAVFPARDSTANAAVANQVANAPNQAATLNQPLAGDAQNTSVAGVNAVPAALPTELNAPASDWVPLGTLVRLPVLARLQCPQEATQPCSLIGTNLFLLESVAADPGFTTAVPVPDGFTGSTLSIPHISGTMFFLKLRDDVSTVNSATVPISITNSTASTTHRGARIPSAQLNP